MPRCPRTGRAVRIGPDCRRQSGPLGTLSNASGKGGFGLIYIERQQPGLLLTRWGTGGAGSAHNPARVCFMTGWPLWQRHALFLLHISQPGEMQESAQTAMKSSCGSAQRQARATRPQMAAGRCRVKPDG